MLSIPRDLWVEIPASITTGSHAYMLGEAYKLPGGGPALASETVEGVIGVPIEYYAVIDFKSFENVIDQIADRRPGGGTIKIAPSGARRFSSGQAYHLTRRGAGLCRVRKAAG